MRRTDEEIIAAILEGGSIRAAAEALGIQTKTIYAREKTKSYQEAYANARRQLVEDAAASLHAKTGEAIQTIYNMMKAESTPPQARLNCAVTILKHAEKLEEVRRLYNQLDELRERQEEANIDDIFFT